MQWKADHEGSNAKALAALGTVDEERLTNLLLEVFSPPHQETPADHQLEKAGRLHFEYRLRAAAASRSWLTAPPAPTCSPRNCSRRPRPFLGTRRFSDMAEKLSAAAGILGAKAMDTRISNLHDAAEMLSIASRPHRKAQRGLVRFHHSPGLRLAG